MGMGNPLLDISATVGQDLLDKYDVKLDSAILAEDKHQPLYQELVDKYDVQYIAGGATQNSMRVAQWMLTSTAQKTNQVAFMGCVGGQDNDKYAKQLQDCANADGVLVHYQKDPKAVTGTCAALILGGERALVANLAAANNFTPSHLETPLAQEIVQSAKFYYCAGFFLTVSVESLVKVATHACEQNKVFCLNLSAPFIVDFFTEQLSTALEYADYVFGNEGEAKSFAVKFQINAGETTEDLQAVAQYICKLPKKNANRPRTVIFTQGSKQTIVCTSESSKEFPVEALAKDQLVDTNGAGDAFVGGFLSQLVQDKELETCVKAGHYAARYIIQQSGTTGLDKPAEFTP